MYLKKKSAVPLIFLALTLGLIVTATSYAHWVDTVRIDGEVQMGTLCIAFTEEIDQLDTGDDWGIVSLGPPPAGSPPYTKFPYEKDVAETIIELYDGDDDDDWLDIMEVTVNNAYPSYYEHIKYEIWNCGSVPFRIWYVVIDFPDHEPVYAYLGNFYEVLDLDGDGDDDMELQWGDNFGIQVDPGDQPLDQSFKIHFLNGMKQNAELSFSFRIVAINWNEYWVDVGVPKPIPAIP